MKSTAKTVGIVMIIMVLSRLLSLGSVIVYTSFFGTDSIEINIYTYALQFPNIVFTVFGTALTTVVIPIFASNLESGNKKRAYKFADNVISLATIFTLILTLIGVLLAPLLPLFTKYSENKNHYDFAVMALRIMFPIMIFYALNYIFQGILQSMGKFNMPAFVTIPSSAIQIGYVIFMGNKFGIKGLLIATLIALSTQALILIPPLLTTEYRYRPSFNYKDEDIRKAVKLIIPIIIGSSAYPLNLFFNVTIAANLGDGDKVTILTLVQQLVSYAVLAFIYSVTAVAFPKFSALASKSDISEFKNSVLKVLTSMFYFLLPATAGFILVRKELLNLIVGWNKFTPENVEFASVLLSLYALGVVGMGVKEVVDRAFYSLKDTKAPAIIGVIIMVVNVSISLLLLPFIDAYGIPLAYSVSILTGAAVLTLMLRKKIGAFGGKKLARVIFKIILSCIIMSAVVFALISVLSGFTFSVTLIDRAIKLIVPAGLGALVYFGSTYVLKIDEAVDVFNKLKAKALRHN
ncbi:MAG: murein biosynthesis integral membrane protein MurJ [Clostridiaceae bacterium]|nr:murein biosynthesis integral membrane protein MurJ [Clostridiaceae bacterium]